MDLSQGLKRLVDGIDGIARSQFVLWSLHISKDILDCAKAVLMHINLSK